MPTRAGRSLGSPCGISGSISRGPCWRAWRYALNDTFQIFQEIGVPVSQVRASGGGAKSPVWRQIHADVTGHAHVTLSVDEGPALGAALLAAVGTGAYASVADACHAAIQTVARTAPDPTAHAAMRSFTGLPGAVSGAEGAVRGRVGDCSGNCAVT